MTQPRRILLIQGHPDAGAPHLCHALADAYAAGAAEGVRGLVHDLRDRPDRRRVHSQCRS